MAKYYEVNTDFLSGDDIDNICSTCGGTGKVTLSEDGQTYEETIASIGENFKICPDCQGNGRHLGMAE